MEEGRDDFRSLASSTEQKEPARALVRVVSTCIWITALVFVYFLSLGPVLRYSSTPISMQAAGAQGGSIRVQGVRYPDWLPVVYYPVYEVVGQDQRPEYGKHDLLNTYKRYLQYWTP